MEGRCPFCYRNYKRLDKHLSRNHGMLCASSGDHRIDPKLVKLLMGIVKYLDTAKLSKKPVAADIVD